MLKKEWGKHEKHVKSGKRAKITLDIRNPQIWPHSELNLLYHTVN